MIQYHEPPAITAFGSTKSLPETKPYVYRGDGHDLIQPEECCADCIRKARRIAQHEAAKREREGR